MDDVAARQVAENEKLYDQFWRGVIGSDTRLATTGGNPYQRKQAEKEATVRLQAGMRAAFSVAIRPLPVNHHLVPGPQPAPRTDLVNLQELSQVRYAGDSVFSHGLLKRK
jgi:hypothetical protein